MKYFTINTTLCLSLFAFAACNDKPDTGIAECEALAENLQRLTGATSRLVNTDAEVVAYIEAGQALETGRDISAGNIPIGVVLIQYNVDEMSEVDDRTMVERVFCYSE